jgi:hypothetical protein
MFQQNLFPGALMLRALVSGDCRELYLKLGGAAFVPLQSVNLLQLGPAMRSRKAKKNSLFLLSCLPASVMDKETNNRASVTESSVVLPPSREGSMTNTQPTVRATDVSNWPTCSKCRTMMVLTCIEPHTTGYDMRIFECPSCDHSECAVVHF